MKKIVNVFFALAPLLLFALSIESLFLGVAALSEAALFQSITFVMLLLIKWKYRLSILCTVIFYSGIALMLVFSAIYWYAMYFK